MTPVKTNWYIFLASCFVIHRQGYNFDMFHLSTPNLGPPKSTFSLRVRSPFGAAFSLITILITYLFIATIFPNSENSTDTVEILHQLVQMVYPMSPYHTFVCSPSVSGESQLAYQLVQGSPNPSDSKRSCSSASPGVEWPENVLLELEEKRDWIEATNPCWHRSNPVCKYCD